jgi:chromosome segregation ATPase
LIGALEEKIKDLDMMVTGLVRENGVLAEDLIGRD